MVTFDDGISLDFVEFWERYSAARLSSDNAITKYVYFINTFFKDTGCTPIDCDALTAKSYIDSLRADVSSDRIMFSTAMSRRSMLRSMRQFAIDEGLIHEPVNVFSTLTFSDISVPAKTLPSVSELLALLELSKSDTKARLIFALLIKCGLKTSELLNLHRNDFCMSGDEPCLRIRGNNMRHLYLPSDVLPFVNDFFTEYDFITPSSNAFISRRKTPLKQRDLDRLIVKYVNLGKEKGVIHRSFTAADIRLVSISAMLCGTTMSNTAKYTGITTRWLFRLDYEVELLNAAKFSVIDFD